MTWLSFISEVIKALAWPVAAISIALIFREELRKLLHRIKKGKVGPTEFEFEQEVQALEEAVNQELDSQPAAQRASAPLLELADIDPSSAILKAWLLVERAMGQLAANRGLGSGSVQINRFRAIRDLERSQVIPSHLMSLYHDLKALRNKAAHDADFSPSKESVINYLELSGLLIGNLELLAKAS